MFVAMLQHVILDPVASTFTRSSLLDTFISWKAKTCENIAKKYCSALTIDLKVRNKVYNEKNSTYLQPSYIRVVDIKYYHTVFEVIDVIALIEVTKHVNISRR